MVYADSSFLVSPYVQDSHREVFLARISLRPTIQITSFHKVEVAHAIFLHIFYNQLSTGEAERAWSEFQLDCRAGTWISVELPEQAWNTAIALARRYGPVLGNRTIDSLHVACALELRADRFWTFDERQSRLAKATGLSTNP